MILIPIGHEQEGTRRLPWVTFGVMILCALAFFMTGRQALFPEDDVEASEDATRAFEYYLEHPYLELDPRFQEKFFPQNDGEEFEAFIEAYRGMAGPPPALASERESEQRVLDGLMSEALEAFSGHPLMRWGLVPDDISFVALFTHMFLHAGWLHLIGNMLILYLAGPFIEDVWGRPLYLGFYLVSGIVAAFVHIGFHPDSTVPMIGASGAIAGVMGAFLVRYRTTQIRFFYMFGLLFRGTFSAPAWVMLPLWFGQQLFLGLLTKDMGEGAGVAYWAHVGGFVCGLGVAGLIRTMQVEERFIHPSIESKVDSTVISNEAVDRALQAQAAGRPQQAFELLVAETRRSPANYDAALALWAVALELGRAAEAAPALVRAIGHELRAGDSEQALAQWEELVENVPGVRADAAVLMRLAQALLERGHKDRAVATLRQALLNAGPNPGAPLALRLANFAADLDPAVARGAVRLALAQTDIDPDTRVEAERLLQRIGRPATDVPPAGAGIPLS